MVLLLVAVVLSIAVLQSVDDADTSAATKPAEKEETTQSTVKIRATTTTTSVTQITRAPKDVTVVVLNGTDADGIAGKYTTQLQALNFTMEKAADSASNVNDTVVYYKPGYQNEARSIATAMKLESTAVQAIPTDSPAPDASKAQIVVVVGADLVEG